MEDLLFLTQRLPFPPQKGDKIRSWHILRHLASSHRVHLGCFFDDPEDEQHIPRLREVCASLCCLPLVPRLARLRSLGAIPRRRSLTERYFHDRRLVRWIGEVMTRHRPRRAFVFCSAMAPYLRGHDFATAILDLVDVDSEKWRQYAETSRRPMSAVYRREARTLLALERRAAASFDYTLLVSPAEADLFKRCAPEAAARVRYMANGVDLDYFRPDESHANPYPTRDPVVIFTGAMDYWPNVQAVEWFARSVMPLLRASRPTLGFWIVGANPAPTVTRLADRAGVHVTGRVADIRPYIAHADVVVAPLQIARGIQNKVLEAMAMAKPIVATPAAQDGLAARSGEELLTAAAAHDFADGVLRLLADGGEAMGRRARARVEADHRWDANLRIIDTLLERPQTAAAARTAHDVALAAPTLRGT